MEITRKRTIIIGLMALVIAVVFSGFYYKISLAMTGHDMDASSDCVEHCLSSITNQQLGSTVMVTGGIEPQAPIEEFELLPIPVSEPILEPFFNPPNLDPSLLLIIQRRE